MRTMPRMRRRLLISSALTAAASVAAPALASPARTRLPRMTEGPFYPPRSWRADSALWPDQDADLTTVRRKDGVSRAQGEGLGLEAQVLDSAGRAIDGAEIEIWQCDTLAAYRHPSVPATTGRFDPGFQGYGATVSGKGGELRFRTIRPVAYPGRTPHIHLKITHTSFGTLTTQLFVAGDPGNAGDFLWRQLDAAARQAAAMQLQPAPEASGLRWLARHPLIVPA
ncbi:intradiol ring-cleavage dioxygenase [Hylemonella gracilis ATCC 19624]|uniref:Intradiol ring-cleavage dioxygenase n=2 Tax=Hylemonella gracilis TaxID=80880 RepID=F3KXR7_9BURK|nr:intradiol ring-cleavage dioxygenase [Hylemonella gracilis ATCC 19624]